MVVEPRPAEWRDAETEPAPGTVLGPEPVALVDHGVLTGAMAAQVAMYAGLVRFP